MTSGILTLMRSFLNYYGCRNVAQCIIMLTEKWACSTDNSLSPIFSVHLWSMFLITGQWRWVQSKKCYFMFTYTFLAFLFVVAVIFHQKICVFIIIISFFWCSIKFLQQNINQSETRIGDRKLSVELYEWGKALDGSIGNI